MDNSIFFTNDQELFIDGECYNLMNFHPEFKRKLLYIKLLQDIAIRSVSDFENDVTNFTLALHIESALAEFRQG